jgi:hypothetical protein
MKNRAEIRKRVLDPSERASEVLFGLIMVLTFTGSLSAAEAGREDVRLMLIGALGCNLAWGIVDAVMYVMNSMAARGREILTLRRVRETSDAAEAHRHIAEALPTEFATALGDSEIATIRTRLMALPEPPRYSGPTRDDFVGAVGVFLLVFLSTFPVVIPFLFMHEATRALRFSNAIAIVMLYLVGHALGRYSGGRPWRTGLGMVAVGVVLVVITIALGG